MDPQEQEEEEVEFPETTTTTTTRTKKKGLHVVVLRCLVLLLFPVVAFLSLSFLIGFVALFLGNSSLATPISVPSQCKIVSSSVDLRSSKVEYKDHLSGQARVALAEAPSEALPLDCRPNFGSAWLAKDKFKVNESYDCWYTTGFAKVNIYQDNFFSCQAKDPSVIEMIRRYNILSTRILQSWFSSRGRVKSWRWETVAGVVTGFSTPLISISLFRILNQMKSRLQRISVLRTFPLAVYASRLKRACFLVAYFSFMGWLAIQYGKKVGLLAYNTIR